MYEFTAAVERYISESNKTKKQKQRLIHRRSPNIHISLLLFIIKKHTHFPQHEKGEFYIPTFGFLFTKIWLFFRFWWIEDMDSLLLHSTLPYNHTLYLNLIIYIFYMKNKKYFLTTFQVISHNYRPKSNQCFVITPLLQLRYHSSYSPKKKKKSQ